jgi:hypothetical protein
MTLTPDTLTIDAEFAIPHHLIHLTNPNVDYTYFHGDGYMYGMKPPSHALFLWIVDQCDSLAKDRQLIVKSFKVNSMDNGKVCLTLDLE